MKKVIILNGSPRKNWNTYKMCESFANVLIKNIKWNEKKSNSRWNSKRHLIWEKVLYKQYKAYKKPRV